ncbi:hypothetical protein N2152v2_002869 [Parachlorella kessleri]
MQRTRICPFHSQQPLIVVSGKSVRFCALCKRLQPVEDFDGDKRSCRTALADHNRRRRKRRSQDAARADGGGSVRSEDGLGGGAWSPYARSPRARSSPDSQQHKRAAAGSVAAEQGWWPHEQQQQQASPPQQYQPQRPGLPKSALVPVQPQHQQSSGPDSSTPPIELQSGTGHVGGSTAGFLVELARMLSINSSGQGPAPGCASGGGWQPQGTQNSASQSASSGASDGPLQQQQQQQEQQARLRALLEQVHHQQPQPVPPQLAPAADRAGEGSAALAAALAAVVAAASIGPYPPATEAGRERSEMLMPRGEESTHAGSSARSSLEAMPLPSLRGMDAPGQSWPSVPGPEVPELPGAQVLLRELSTVLSSGELPESLPGLRGFTQQAPSSLSTEASEVLQALLVALSIHPTPLSAHAASQRAGHPLLVPALQGGPALPAALSAALPGLQATSVLPPAPAPVPLSPGGGFQPGLQQRQQQQPEVLGALALLAEVALSMSAPAKAPAPGEPSCTPYQQPHPPLSPQALLNPERLQRLAPSAAAQWNSSTMQMQGTPGNLAQDLIQQLSQVLAAASPRTATSAAPAAMSCHAMAAADGDAALLQSLMQWGGSPSQLHEAAKQQQQLLLQQQPAGLPWPAWQASAGQGVSQPSETAALAASVADVLISTLTQSSFTAAGPAPAPTPALAPSTLVGQRGDLQAVEQLRNLMQTMQR